MWRSHQLIITIFWDVKISPTYNYYFQEQQESIQPLSTFHHARIGHQMGFGALNRQLKKPPGRSFVTGTSIRRRALHTPGCLSFYFSRDSRVPSIGEGDLQQHDLTKNGARIMPQLGGYAFLRRNFNFHLEPRRVAFDFPLTSTYFGGHNFKTTRGGRNLFWATHTVFFTTILLLGCPPFLNIVESRKNAIQYQNVSLFCSAIIHRWSIARSTS